MFVSKRFVLFTSFSLFISSSFAQVPWFCGCQVDFDSDFCTTDNEYTNTQCFADCLNQTIACTGRCPCYRDPSEIPPPEPCRLKNDVCETHGDCCGGCARRSVEICDEGVCTCGTISIGGGINSNRPEDNIDACIVRCPNFFGQQICDGYNQTLRSDCWANCTARPIAHEGRCNASIPVHRPDDLCQAEGAYCVETTTPTECCKCPNGADGICTRRRCRCPLIPLTPSSPADGTPAGFPIGIPAGTSSDDS